MTRFCISLEESVETVFWALKNSDGREIIIPKLKSYNKTLKLCHSTVGKAILNTSITIVFGFSILVL